MVDAEKEEIWAIEEDEYAMEREDENKMPEFYFDEYTEGFLNGLGICTRMIEETNANDNDPYPYYDYMKVETKYFAWPRLNRSLQNILGDICSDWNNYTVEQCDILKKIVFDKLEIKTKD